MRVLILHSRYLSGDASGENRVALDEEQLLREGGHEVFTWFPAPEIAGAIGRLRSGAAAIWSTSSAATVAKLVREREVDIVHVHNLFPTLSPAVLRAARQAGAAVVMTLHNYRLVCLPANFLREGRVCEDCLGHLPWRGVVHRCYRDSVLGSGVLAASISLHRGVRTFDEVARYLAVSEFVRRKHIEAGMDPRRILVKANFTWPAKRREGTGDYFLFLGRLSPEKGLDTILSAWGRGEISRKLVVVGDGPSGPELRREAPAGVEFMGQVPAEEVPQILGGARALLIPSRWYEAAPRSITEAYAAGVPVVASDIGALPEAIEEGVSGYLAPANDPAAWADAACRLLDDRESERLGEGAQKRWEDLHSPQRGLEGLEAAYRAAIAAGWRSGSG